MFLPIIPHPSPFRNPLSQIPAKKEHPPEGRYSFGVIYGTTSTTPSKVTVQSS